MGRSKLGAVLVAGAATVLAASAYPVSGEQFAIAGKQTVVNEAAGTYKMSGGLLGGWKITSFKELASKPVFKAKAPSRSKAASTSSWTAPAKATRRGR